MFGTAGTNTGVARYLPAALAILASSVWLVSERAFLPHVDDMFYIAWSKTMAEGGAYPAHGLSRFYPTPEYFHYAPRLHIYALSGFWRAFGLNVETLLVFRVVSYVLAAGIVAVAALRRNLPIVAVGFPVVLTLTMLHTGLRAESSALILLLGGFVLLWPHDTKTTGTDTIPPNLAVRTFAKALIILSPLAWPSALAYGAAVLIVSDLYDYGRRPLRRLVLEDAIALCAGVLVLGAMVGFDYGGFIREYSAFAREHDDIFSFNISRLFNAGALLAGAYLIRSISQPASFCAAAIGLSSLLGLVLHTKISIATPLSGLALLSLVDAASRSTPWRKAVLGGIAAIFVLLFANQAMFAFASQSSPAAEHEVRTFARQAREQGRTLLVDEIAAIHGLRLDIGDAYAWSYSMHHPANRPPSLETIREGESWIVSTYTVHGWLKSEAVTGFPAQGPAATALLPGLPCLLGRNSCRLPALRWGYYLVERRNGEVSLRTVP